MAALKIDAPASPLATQNRASQAPAATDFHQFAALRRAADAHDPKALREVLGVPLPPTTHEQFMASIGSPVSPASA